MPRHKNKNPRAHGFSRAFVPSSNRAESDRGAGDRTRTGKPVKAADFRHTASFKAGVACAMPFVRWTMPSPSRAGFTCCPCALGAPRLVSTPSSRMPRGLARRCLDARIRGFAEFEGFCTDRFRPGTQSFKSAMFTNFITPARGRTRFYHCLPMRSLIPRRRITPPRIHPLSSTPPHRRQRFPPAPQHPRYNRIRVVRRPYPSDVCVVLFAKQASPKSSRSHKRFR